MFQNDVSGSPSDKGLIASTQADIAVRQATEKRIRDADRAMREFLSRVIFPVLRSGEAQLKNCACATLTTAHFGADAAGCMLTVNLDENRPPRVLAFEAIRGSTVPAIRWSSGGPVHVLQDLNQAAVEAVVDAFLKECRSVEGRRVQHRRVVLSLPPQGERAAG
jgi:hypothetical protein